MVSKNLRFIPSQNSFLEIDTDLELDKRGTFVDSKTGETFTDGDLTEDEIGEVILNERKILRGKYKQLPIGKPDTANTFYIERK